MKTEATQVLIVGGGPVGLACAIEFGTFGIASILVDRAQACNPFPRMLQVNTRGMQHCRRWGIAEDVRTAGFPPDFPMDILFATALLGREITRFEFPSHGARPRPRDIPENGQVCPQNWFDPIVKRQAEATPHTDIRFNHRFETFHETENGIRATVTDQSCGDEIEISAAFILGCDGANSRVRELLEIEMPGVDHDYNLSALFRAPALHDVHLKKRARHNYYFCETGIDCVLHAIDGGTTWRLGITGLKERQNVETMDIDGGIRRAIGRTFDYERGEVLQWQRSTRSSERYAKGRAFLVGDAAHSWSPNGGFGMNTGLSDAVDLCWKVAGMVQGWGGKDLAASYDAERRPICEKTIEEARSNYRALKGYGDLSDINDDGAAGERTRAALGQKIQDANRRQYDSMGIQMGYHYERSPICVDDGSPAPTDRHDVYEPTARPGHIAPHAWLAEDTSTMDSFRNGFTLLRFGDRPADASPIADAAKDLSVPLGVHDIADPDAAAGYEMKMVLVRPDGHVAWRGDTAPDRPAEMWNRLRGA